MRYVEDWNSEEYLAVKRLIQIQIFGEDISTLSNEVKIVNKIDNYIWVTQLQIKSQLILSVVACGFIFSLLIQFPKHFLSPPLPFVSFFLCVCTKSLQSCPTLCHPMDCSPPGSFVHGILQARTLEWVAISSSTGSFWPRDQIHVSCIGRRVFYHWATRKAPLRGIWEAKDRAGRGFNLSTKPILGK